MIVALRSLRDIAAMPPLGPKARAVSLALGAVLLWASWPTLATWAQPAPPFLVLGLGAATGFALSLSRAAATGQVHAFVTTPPKTLALVAVGLLTNNILYLMAMPRIGPAEANVISYLWPILLVMIMSRLHRSALSGGQWIGILSAFGGLRSPSARPLQGGLILLVLRWPSRAGSCSRSMPPSARMGRSTRM